MLLLFLSLSAVPVAAQDEMVPDEIGGSVAEVTVFTGPGLLAKLDPVDAHDAKRIAMVETLLAVTGRTIDELSAAAAFPTDGGPGGHVVALRVAGADVAVLYALVISDIRADLAQPRQETAEIGSKEIIRINEDAADDEPPFSIYGRGDTVWFIGGSDAEVAALLEQLP